MTGVVVYMAGMVISCSGPFADDIATCGMLPPNAGIHSPIGWPANSTGWPYYCIENTSRNIGWFQIRVRKDGNVFEVLMSSGLQPCAKPEV